MRELDAGIAVRIGVNTGEVVAGDAARREMFATGDVVTRRRGQRRRAARAGRRAGRDPARRGDLPARRGRGDGVEPVPPIEAKGKSEPLDRLPAAEHKRAGRSPAPHDGRTRRAGRGARAARVASSNKSSRSVAAGCSLSWGSLGWASRGSPRSCSTGSGSGRGSCGAPASPTARESPTGPSRRSSASWQASATRDSADEAREPRPATDRAAARARRGIGRLRSRRVGDRQLPCRRRAGRGRSSCSSTTSTGPSPRCSTCSRSSRGASTRRLSLSSAWLGPELLEQRPDWDVTVQLEPLGAAHVDALLERLEAPVRGPGADRPGCGRQPALRRGAGRHGRARAATSTSFRRA